MLNDPDSSGSAVLYLAETLYANLRQGGTFGYQRERNPLTGYTQLPQFRDVANLNVGLFCQQAGLTLEEARSVAGLYARVLSSNAKPAQPYHLDTETEQFIAKGFQTGCCRLVGEGLESRFHAHVAFSGPGNVYLAVQPAGADDRRKRPN
jgi:hypothetical protein